MASMTKQIMNDLDEASLAVSRTKNHPTPKAKAELIAHIQAALARAKAL